MDIDLATAKMHRAPDGSTIHEFSKLEDGSVALCTLPPGVTSHPVKHKTVEEIWYFLAGRGEVWRKNPAGETVTAVSPDGSITIPLGTTFQFRNTGSEPLRFLITTMPPWPLAGDAVPADGPWVGTA